MLGRPSVRPGSGIPRGTICMWYGDQASIPTGWTLCDGAGSTPDLRNRFIVGGNADGPGNIPYSSVDGAPKATGGNINHNHSLLPAGLDTGLGAGWDDVTDTKQHIPPFRALYFIMKL